MKKLKISNVLHVCYESFKGLEIDRMKIPLKELKIIGSFALVHSYFPGMQNTLTL